MSFTNVVTGVQAGDWPFTATIATIRTDPNGFVGGGEGHRLDQTILMVQVAVTDQMPGQLPPIPQLPIACTSPDPTAHLGLNAVAVDGWDNGPDSGPDPQGANVTLGDGQPHDWDVAWKVPANFDSSTVKCRLMSGYGLLGGDIKVHGSGALN